MQGDWTKQEARATRDTFKEVLEALPKESVVEYLGHARDVFAFLESAEKHAPNSPGMDARSPK